ncbi:MAG: SDR family NAD(P)-dependent oxidoreductase, partial [Salinisphaera sp.]|nr:SDR family NAD(P)-dependent oxidoreductase [Salinisphaera sp.]
SRAARSSAPAVAGAAPAAGATVVLVGRREKTLTPVYDDIVAAGGPTPALFPMDFTRAAPEHYQALADGIANDLGRLDGVLHAAGRLHALTPLAGLELAEWQRSLHVNLTAAFAVTQACLPLLLAAPDAAVVFVADRVGRRPKAYWGAYAAAKAGTDALLSLFAAEYGHRDNLRFHALDPGPLDTPLRTRVFPSGDPAAQPLESAVPACLHLLGPASRGISGRRITVAELAADA